MTDTPSPLARRITRRLIEETGCEIPECELLELVHENTKELRPIHALADSLKATINRIIQAKDPKAELLAIAAAVGVPVAE
jgi:hypothetical protein